MDPIDPEVARRFMLSDVLPSDKIDEASYKLTAFLLDTRRWDAFRDPQWADQGNVIGSPTVEMFFKNLQVRYQLPEPEKCYTRNGEGFYNAHGYNICIDVSDDGEFLFSYPPPFTDLPGYWLANPAFSNEAIAYYGYRLENMPLFDGDRGPNDSFAVRPVVRLKTGLKLKSQGEDLVLVSE